MEGATRRRKRRGGGENESVKKKLYVGLVIYSRGRLQNVEYDIAAVTIYVEYQS